jgi:hypothetical protein
MKRVLLLVSLVPSVMFVVALTAAPGTQQFIGTITDSMCANAVHSQMKMGATDSECAVACVGIHDADFVLYDGKQAYVLSHHQAVEQLAGQKVRVTGTLDAGTKTIHVESIAAAK